VDSGAAHSTPKEQKEMTDKKKQKIEVVRLQFIYQSRIRRTAHAMLEADI